MKPAAVLFYGGVLMATALCIVLINSLPTIFDVITVSAGTIGGVIVGRKSIDWF